MRMSHGFGLALLPFVLCAGTQATIVPSEALRAAAEAAAKAEGTKPDLAAVPEHGMLRINYDRCSAEVANTKNFLLEFKKEGEVVERIELPEGLPHDPTGDAGFWNVLEVPLPGVEPPYAAQLTQLKPIQRSWSFPVVEGPEIGLNRPSPTPDDGTAVLSFFSLDRGRLVCGQGKEAAFDGVQVELVYELYTLPVTCMVDFQNGNRGTFQFHSSAAIFCEPHGEEAVCVSE